MHEEINPGMFFFKCLFPIGPGTFDTFDAGMGLNLGDDRRDARHSELEKNARARGVRGARVHHRARRRHPGAARAQATRRRR